MWSFFAQLIKIIQFISGYILYLTLIQSTITAQSLNCLPGCKCSTNELNTSVAVICCLIDRTRLLSLSHVINNYPTDIKNCDIDLNHYSSSHITTFNSNSINEWPSYTLCLPLWRQLKIQLTENSWPTLITNHKKQSTESKCMLNLERLAIVGQLNTYDGFIQLDTNEFHNYFFSNNANSALKLHRFTIEQTSLRRISQGFFDEIHALNLIDLEIRRNVNLTDKGFGVGWLANMKQLQSLDLSLNHLYTIDLANWGLPKHQISLLNLDLSGNHLVHLKAQTFIRLPNLIYLNLANNYLTTLSSNVFYGLNHLKFLDLQGNQLKTHSLTLTVPNFHVMLPELKQLILSRNPLAIPTFSSSNNVMNNNNNAEQPIWWFTHSCPKFLTTLHLENIEPTKYVKHSINQSLLKLPTFAWDYCDSLTDVYLAHNDWLTCLDRRWLGVALLSNEAGILSNRFRIHPSTLELCPLRFDSARNHDSATKSGILTETISTNGSQLLGTTHLQTTSISLSSIYWPISTEDAVHAAVVNTKNHNYHKNNLVSGGINASINSWIILCIIVILICVVFFTIVFATIYCMRFVNKRLNKQISYTSSLMTNGLHHHQQQNHLTPDLNTYKAANSMDASSRILPPYSFNCMDLNKTNQLFHYTDIHPMCSSCFSLKRAITQPVSPADSGLEDGTPLTIQQTRHAFPSLDRPSQRSSRRSRHHNHHHRRALFDIGFTRCPSTSVSSLLLLQHSPNRHVPEMSYGWPASMNFSSHRVNAATSTDDVSIGPASTSVDTGDACSTPSDKVLPVGMNECKETTPMNTTTNDNSNNNKL